VALASYHQDCSAPRLTRTVIARAHVRIARPNPAHRVDL